MDELRDGIVGPPTTAEGLSSATDGMSWASELPAPRTTRSFFFRSGIVFVHLHGARSGSAPRQFRASIENGHVATIGEQPPSPPPCHLADNAELLQVGDRLHHSRMGHLQLAARGNDADNRL